VKTATFGGSENGQGSGCERSVMSSDHIRRIKTRYGSTYSYVSPA
jgi:hypothetical protein